MKAHTTPERGVPSEELAVEHLRELAAQACVHAVRENHAPVGEAERDLALAELVADRDASDDDPAEAGAPAEVGA
jgi:hypothetical protein